MAEIKIETEKVLSMSTEITPEQTAKALEELNEWIAINLFGWKRETRKMYGGEKNVKGWGRNTHLSLGSPDREFVLWLRDSYTTDPAASMQVLDKIREFGAIVCIHGEAAAICSQIGGRRIEEEAPTLPLAIAKFAQQLFKKEN